MSSCPTLVPDGAFLHGMLTYIDCQAHSIGESGYLALASPGSSASLVLTGLLTIFIAMFGYRLILGDTPTARDGIIAVVKIGIVLMLATSWGAYRPLVYDVAMHGPARLAADVGGASGVPGAGGGLVDWLQSVDDGLVALSAIGVGQPRSVAIAPDATANAAQVPTPAPQQQSRWDPLRDETLIKQARTLYLTSAIAAFASVRLIAGFLLALGPLFVMCLLFDTTRGLFEGWVRGLVGAMIGSAATAIILGVELALMGPWLAGILASRNADIATPSVPVELFVVTLVFGLTLIAALVATGWVALGFRLPPVLRTATVRAFDRLSGSEGQMRAPLPAVGRVPEAVHSRALAVADAVQVAQRRDSGMRLAVTGVADHTRNPATPSWGSEAVPTTPLGRSFRRRVVGRVSAGAGRRDVSA